MSFTDLQAMTVIQLRKIARENSVVLRAGIDKAAMIETIAQALGITVPSQQTFLRGVRSCGSCASFRICFPRIRARPAGGACARRGRARVFAGGKGNREGSGFTYP